MASNVNTLGAQRRLLIENSKEPLLFAGALKWKLLDWNLDEYSRRFADFRLPFRQGKVQITKAPQWERNCPPMTLTMKEFVEMQNRTNDTWLYFDYKYMHDWFAEKFPDIIEDVSWLDFGFDKNGDDSTIWIGSEGAHTPCHVDTYGCNLVAQVYGRKSWLLFPPDEDLQPTRVPYEESSVYSKLNLFGPDASTCERLKTLQHARKVVLSPGDILYLPPRWWHYVENLETAISVNIWLPTAGDDEKRLEESLVQMFVAQVVKDLDAEKRKLLLNPNQTHIADLPLCILLQQVQHCIDKDKSSEKNQALTQSLKSLARVVPELSEEEYRSFIQSQSEKPHTEGDECNNEDITIIGNIINAFCHPETISICKNKLSSS